MGPTMRYGSVGAAVGAVALKSWWNSLAVDDATYEGLAAHFSLEEVVELQMFCALMLAGGRLAYVQRAWGDDDRPPVLTATTHVHG